MAKWKLSTKSLRIFISKDVSGSRPRIELKSHSNRSNRSAHRGRCLNLKEFRSLFRRESRSRKWTLDLMNLSMRSQKLSNRDCHKPNKSRRICNLWIIQRRQSLTRMRRIQRFCIHTSQHQDKWNNQDKCQTFFIKIQAHQLKDRQVNLKVRDHGLVADQFQGLMTPSLWEVVDNLWALNKESLTLEYKRLLELVKIAILTKCRLHHQASILHVRAHHEFSLRPEYKRQMVAVITVIQ